MELWEKENSPWVCVLLLLLFFSSGNFSRALKVYIHTHVCALPMHTCANSSPSPGVIDQEGRRSAGRFGTVPAAAFVGLLVKRLVACDARALLFRQKGDMRTHRRKECVVSCTAPLFFFRPVIYDAATQNFCAAALEKYCLFIGKSDLSL